MLSSSSTVSSKGSEDFSISIPISVFSLDESVLSPASIWQNFSCSVDYPASEVFSSELLSFTTNCRIHFKLDLIRSGYFDLNFYFFLIILSCKLSKLALKYPIQKFSCFNFQVTKLKNEFASIFSTFLNVSKFCFFKSLISFFRSLFCCSNLSNCLKAILMY